MSQAPHAGGMISLRDYLAANAPIDLNMALRVYMADEMPAAEPERSNFLRVWALLRYEYADAMMSISSFKESPPPAEESLAEILRAVEEYQGDL